MIGYLIDPFWQTVTQVEFSGGAISQFVDLGDGCDTATVNKHRDMVIVDDIGYSREPQAWFTYGDYHNPLAGKAFLFGCGPEGETQSARASLDEVSTAITWGKR